MRNLVLVADSVIVLDNVNISATAVDLDENVIYAVSEKQNFDGDVDVELWNFGKIQSSELIGVCCTSGETQNVLIHRTRNLHLSQCSRLSLLLGDPKPNK